MPRTKQTVAVASGAISQLRKEFGWTQQELAERAGLGLRTIVNLEKKGAQALPRATLEPIAKVFSVPRSDLIQDDREPRPPHKRRGCTYQKITIFLNGKRKDLDEVSDLPRIIEAYLSSPEEPEYVVVLAVRQGSVAIDIETTTTGTHNAIFNFLNGRFPLRNRVKSIAIPDSALLPAWLILDLLRHQHLLRVTYRGAEGIVIARRKHFPREPKLEIA